MTTSCTIGAPQALDTGVVPPEFIYGSHDVHEDLRASHAGGTCRRARQWKAADPTDHVAIYLNDKQMLHSGSCVNYSGVCVRSIDWSAVVAIARVPVG